MCGASVALALLKCGIWMANHRERLDKHWHGVSHRETERIKCLCWTEKMWLKKMGSWMYKMKSGVCFYNPDFIVIFDALAWFALYFSSTAYAHWNPNERENFMAWQWQQGGINFNKNNLLLLAAFFRLKVRLLRWDVFFFFFSQFCLSFIMSHVVQVIASLLCFLK